MCFRVTKTGRDARTSWQGLRPVHPASEASDEKCGGDAADDMKTGASHAAAEKKS
jgi:hypothetical protein